MFNNRSTVTSNCSINLKKDQSVSLACIYSDIMFEAYVNLKVTLHHRQRKNRLENAFVCKMKIYQRSWFALHKYVDIGSSDDSRAMQLCRYGHW